MAFLKGLYLFSLCFLLYSPCFFPRDAPDNMAWYLLQLHWLLQNPFCPSPVTCPCVAARASAFPVPAAGMVLAEWPPYRFPAPRNECWLQLVRRLVCTFLHPQLLSWLELKAVTLPGLLGGVLCHWNASLWVRAGTWSGLSVCIASLITQARRACQFIPTQPSGVLQKILGLTVVNSTSISAVDLSPKAWEKKGNTVVLVQTGAQELIPKLGVN